ncbi:MAG: type II toxin-antitoxin system antitoxin SocA domain-containing protein [Parcubacteria group bacterium]
MFGKLIRQQRKKFNLSQEYLALELGISRPTLVQIERGERDLTINEARKIADVFAMRFEDFIAGKTSKVPKREVIIEKGKSRLKQVDLKIRVTSKNLDKFKQILLYILGKIGGKPNVGETVLHKLLYFIDFDYYEKFEENLMGATYIKNHHGPTSVELGPIIKDMQADKEIETVNSKYFKYEQKKYLPLKRPDLGRLTAREVEHIDDVLARLSDKNAKEIENYSHGDIPWKTAERGEPLSYESVFYRDERYSVRNYDDEL